MDYEGIKNIQENLETQILEIEFDSDLIWIDELKKEVWEYGFDKLIY